MITYIKNMFRKKYTVTIHLKSGAILTHRAYKFDIKTIGNDLQSVSHDWVERGLLYFRLDDVSAIEFK